MPRRLALLFVSLLASFEARAVDFDGVVAWIEANRTGEPAFAAGDRLTRNDLDRMRPFVAPGFIDRLDFEGFEAVIREPQSMRPHRSYRAASLEFAGQTTLAPDGALENYVAGQPFSRDRILAADGTSAAYMVAWNQIYRWQYYGYRSDRIHFVFLQPGPPGGRTPAIDRVLLGGGHVERHLIEAFQRVHLSHLAMLPETQYALDVEGGGRLRYKDYITFTHPFEMRGSTFVIERPVDPYEQDQVNSYLPTERRVRRLSPKERADSFVGSEFTLDDFEGFSGRVLDYEWAFRGVKPILYVPDMEGPHATFFGPSSNVPKGGWQLRPCWVVEQIPKLAEHSYGRKLIFVDMETHAIAMTLIFDRKAQLLKILYPGYSWLPGPDDDGDRLPPSHTVLNFRSNVVINVQTGASSMVWSESTEIEEVKPSHVRRLFSVSNLTGGR